MMMDGLLYSWFLHLDEVVPEDEITTKTQPIAARHDRLLGIKNAVSRSDVTHRWP